jgi:hypothetical protein
LAFLEPVLHQLILLEKDIILILKLLPEQVGLIKIVLDGAMLEDQFPHFEILFVSLPIESLPELRATVQKFLSYFL